MPTNKDAKFQLFRQTMMVDFERLSHVTDPALSRLQERYLKRFETHNRELDARAIADFKGILNSMRNFKPGVDPLVMSNARLFIHRALCGFTKKVCPDTNQLDLSLSYLFSLWRFGPGASNGVTGTHFADKILQPMTVTPDAKSYVKTLRRLNPYLRNYNIANGDQTALVRGSRLTTVPKNNDTARTIAIEPSGNMAMQLALGHYLENVLRYVGLDIRCQQPINKNMARIGSIDGSLATLDLSSASDRISIDLVRSLFPPSWFYMFMACRSPEIQIGEEHFEVTMMSTMGNGFTFPLMTLIISSLLYGYYASIEAGSLNRIDWSCNAVFGDDIIIPTEYASGYISVLESAGFLVNTKKSYLEGPFRESCGGDFYSGVDVTPFYIESLDNDPEIYIAINKTLDWSRKTGYVLWSTLRLFKSMLSGPCRCVPEWEEPYSGILTKDVSKVYSLYIIDTVHKSKVIDSLDLLMLCVLGGYVLSTSRDNHIRYNPRGFVRYKVIRRQLPRGRLDGRGELINSREVGRVRVSDIIPWL